MTDARPFRYDAEVDPGETRHLRYEVGETYLGDPVELPITVINGSTDGPRVFLTAALHGDELNGVKVAQEVAARYEPAEIAGTLVICHVVNVPGYLAQTRDIPIYDLDLNRSFPGRPAGNTADRLAHELYTRFLAPCDYGIDLHTSTRNRTTMFHVRAAMEDSEVTRIAKAFGANVVLSGDGEPGALRTTATNDGIPTITVEMGEAHRFQPELIDRATGGIESVLAEVGVLPDEPVDWPGWRKVIAGPAEKTWLRADHGGLVERVYETPLVYEDEPICTISDHFGTEEHLVTAPFTGLVVGILQNPVALPGHPLCHFVRIDDETRTEIEAELERGELDW